MSWINVSLNRLGLSGFYLSLSEYCSILRIDIWVWFFTTTFFFDSWKREKTTSIRRQEYLPCMRVSHSSRVACRFFFCFLFYFSSIFIYPKPFFFFFVWAPNSRLVSRKTKWGVDVGGLRMKDTGAGYPYWLILSLTFLQMSFQVDSSLSSFGYCLFVPLLDFHREWRKQFKNGSENCGGK